jgi:hypothetical protein
MFEKTLKDKPERAARLADQVKSLCIEVDPYEDEGGQRDCWNILVGFRNLEVLEIHAWTSKWNEVLPFDTPSATLTKLRKVKLYGHVPISFARFIYRSAASTTRSFEICLLDERVASNRAIEEKEPSITSNGDAISHDSGSEDMDRDMVEPRLLAFLGLIESSSFIVLSQLWLCKPALSSQNANENNWCKIYFSPKFDRSVLLEWAALLRSIKSISTLRHLTFEHRLVAPEIESDSTSSDEYMVRYRHGPSNRLFLGLVLPVLLEEGGWLALKRLWFHGITLETQSNEQGLQIRFPGVEIKSSIGKRMLFSADYGTACNYGGGDCLGWKDMSII